MTGEVHHRGLVVPTELQPGIPAGSHQQVLVSLRETMPPEERNALILERLKQVTRYAYDRSAFYRRHWERAGFHPDHLKDLEDFEEKVPVITKGDLRESQVRVPGFGDYLCISEDEIHHIHGTSGTTGQPTAFAVGRGDWDAIGNAHARIMWGMGLRPGDTVFIASLFSLYWGSWGTLIGSQRLRAKSFPFGAGAPGMTARAVGWLRQIKPTAFYSTPSYALHLAEAAASQGVDPLNSGSRSWSSRVSRGHRCRACGTGFGRPMAPG